MVRTGAAAAPLSWHRYPAHVRRRWRVLWWRSSCCPSLVLPVAALAVAGAPSRPRLDARRSAAHSVYGMPAGALTLIGLCAALFSEADAVALIERDR
jgi:hypothetical protein